MSVLYNCGHFPSKFGVDFIGSVVFLTDGMADGPLANFDLKILRWNPRCQSVDTLMPSREQFSRVFLPLLGLPDSVVMCFKAVQRAWIHQTGVGACLFLTGDDGPQAERLYATFV